MKKFFPRQKAIDWIVYVLIRTFVAFMEVFSLEACQTAAMVLAFLVTDVFPVRRRVLEENLSFAFPEKTPRQRRLLIRRMWTHLLLMGVEFFFGRKKIQETNWRNYVNIPDGPMIVRRFYEDRPYFLVTGHFGNFEIGGYLLGLVGYPTFSVARSLDNPFLNRYVADIREATGQYLIEKNGGWEDILTVLKGKGTMAFLADQSAGPKGCRVEFFGRTASAYKAMALLSLQYNAPLVVCYSIREENRPMKFRFEIAGIFDPSDPPEGVTSLRQITQWFTTLLEKGIRQNPEQYWWLHRRWKDFN